MNDIAIRRPVLWSLSQATNVGVVREVNENLILSLPDVQLWAVADCMGGYEAGIVASDMIVKALESLDGELSLNQLSLNDLVKIVLLM